MPRPVNFQDIGPGLLLAATGIGVGDMVSSTIAGAEYGLTLIWALAAGVILKFAITEGAARWQLGTGNTLMEGWRDHLPRAAVLAFFLYFVVWSYFVSSALVAASALVPAAIIPSVPLPVWGFIHAVAAFTMVWFGRYERFLSVIKWFVGLKFGAVIGSVLLIVLWSGADWSHFGAKSAFTTSYTLSLIGGVGGTVTLLSYAYWMREAGWSGPRRISSARTDLTLSFCSGVHLLLLDDLPRHADQLDRTDPRGGAASVSVAGRSHWRGDRSDRTRGVPARVLGRGVLVGARRLSRRAVSLRRLDPPVAAANADGTARRTAYRAWAGYLTLAAISALVIRRPVWLVFAYTVVGSLFFPFVISTLLWLNNSRHATRPRVTGEQPARQCRAERGAPALRSSRGCHDQSVVSLSRWSLSRSSTSCRCVPVRRVGLAARGGRSRAGTPSGSAITRYWFAEHHGMASIASSAPEILIEHIASTTTRICASARAASCCRTTRRCAWPRRFTRSPRCIRAGSISDSAARRAPIRPHHVHCARSMASSFPSSSAELLALSRRTFPPDHPFASVRVVPADVPLPPIWVLGSSGAMAALCGIARPRLQLRASLQPEPSLSLRFVRTAGSSRRRSSSPRRM